jgi:chromosome segregation ATPase
LVTQLKDQLQDAEARLQDAEAKAAEPGDQGADISALQETNQEQEKLLESLTSQLEEREQRANRLQRQVRELGMQIKEHESDIVAWEMELKFRNTRISQLETDNEKIQKELAAKPQKAGPPPPPVPQSIEGAVNAATSPVDNPDALRTKVGQLNEALGDKDAELLILHSQIEDSQRRMEYTRNILEDIIKQNKVDPQTAQQFSDLVQAMK